MGVMVVVTRTRDIYVGAKNREVVDYHKDEEKSGKPLFL